MSAYPIVKVTTSDNVVLHGLLVEPLQTSKSIVINVHGTAGSFYWNDFYQNVSEAITKLDFAYLTTNNRGTMVYELEKGTPFTGAALETFGHCILDINAWIEFAFAKGYEDIILVGHSFGTEKSVYYMNKGKYVDKIKAVVLLGFSDTVGTQQRYEKQLGHDYFSEAKALVEKGEGYRLLNDIYALAGELPISAKTYLDFYLPNSELSQTLPLRQGKDLRFFRNITVPILGVIGDHEDGEYTIVPILEAIKLLKSENPLAEVCQLKNCDHGFSGKESELADLIADFLKRRVLSA